MGKDSRDSSLTTEKRKRSSSSVDAANAASSSSSSKHSHRDKDKRKHKKQSRHSTSSKYSDAESSGVESGAESSASGASRASDGKRKEKSHKKHRSKDSKKTKPDAPPYLTTQPLSSAFESQYPVTTISIPPIHSSDPKLAVTELFDSLIMRFVPPLNGVLVSHGQIFFLTPDGRNVAESASVHPGPSALIDGDGAFAKVKVAVECCVWRPRIGAKIEGTITLSTPSHVSLLINSTFNASIPSSHLTDFEFVEEEDETGMDEDTAVKAEDEKAEESSVLAIAGGQGNSGSGGYWRSKKSKQRLGGASNGWIEFAVIGLTIAGHTLSVSGSLLARPFSVPPPRTLSLQQQVGSVAQRAAAFGFGDGSRGAHTNGKGDDGFSKAKRRVRWEEDEDEEDADDESGDDESPDEADRRQAPAKVKSTPRSAKGSKHVKF
ncbi:unnamed protein product [Jaminaea pallidilutea]